VREVIDSGRRTLSGFAARKLKQKKRYQNESVSDFFFLDQGGNTRLRVKLHLDVFSLIGRSLMNPSTPERQKGMAPVALDCGIGVANPQRNHPIRSEAGLFFEFAQRRGLRILSRLHHPTRNFERGRGDPEPKLANHHHLVIESERNDIDPIGSIDHHPTVDASIAEV